MSLKFTKSGMVITVTLMASVAAPLVIRQSIRNRVREGNDVLFQQRSQVAQLMTDNERLSNQVFEAKVRLLSDEQLRELLKLRAEAGGLRQQTNAIQNLRDENRRLQIGSTLGTNRDPEAKVELSKEISAELFQAMKNVLAELPGARQRFVAEHEWEAQTSFSELRKYFPTSEGRRMPGLYSIEFVRDEGGPKPDDALVLREGSTHQNHDGTTARFYGFSNGQIVEVIPTGEKDSDDYFAAWEKQHMISVSPDRR